MNAGVTIEQACMRDASYVVAAMRPADEEEILCQVSPDAKRHELAYALLMNGENFIASYNGVPAAFYGTSPLNVACLSIWAIGTLYMPRVLPDLTRHLIVDCLPRYLKQGYISMEAKSLVSHASSHRWMTSAGARLNSAAFPYGRNGELFLQFIWSDLALLPEVVERYRVEHQ